MEYLGQHIECLIFAADGPIREQEIRACLEATFETDFKPDEISSAILKVIEKYRSLEYPFEVVAIAGGYQFMTKETYHKTVAQYLKLTMRKRLSRAALETLAIIAYRQPSTKSEVEKIRGVSCDYSIQKLLEKELVSIIGRSEGPGRPLLYGTSDKFMDYFALNSIGDLPKPKDFKAPESEIGEQAPIEEEE